MRAANILAIDAALTVVWDPRLPGLQILDQYVQFRLVLGLATLRLQDRNCTRNIAAPQAAIQPAQKVRFGRLASADPAAEVVALLLQVMPVQQHRLVRER